MRSCEVAIIGLGLMGSSALHSLVRRGADVLGFDPMSMGEARGSSHGSCRVYRRFNFESEAYTDLSDQAFRGWRTLESITGRIILKPSAVLEAGPVGSKMVARSRAPAARKGPITGPIFRHFRTDHRNSTKLRTVRNSLRRSEFLKSARLLQ